MSIRPNCVNRTNSTRSSVRCRLFVQRFPRNVSACPFQSPAGLSATKFQKSVHVRRNRTQFFFQFSQPRPDSRSRLVFNLVWYSGTKSYVCVYAPSWWWWGGGWKNDDNTPSKSIYSGIGIVFFWNLFGINTYIYYGEMWWRFFFLRFIPNGFVLFLLTCIALNLTKTLECELLSV